MGKAIGRATEKGNAGNMQTDKQTGESQRQVKVVEWVTSRIEQQKSHRQAISRNYAKQ